MMLILAICKVLVIFEPPIHLRLPISYLQPSGRASERKNPQVWGSTLPIRLRLISKRKQNSLFFTDFLSLFLFFTAFTSQLPRCQRDEGLNGVEVLESVLNRNKPSEGFFCTN